MAGTLTVTQAACHIPELWSSETRDAVRAKVVAADLVESAAFGLAELARGNADTMNIPYISNPTANTKTANTNVSLEVIGPAGAEASQSFVVGTHQIVAFGVENITEVQAKTDLRAKYTDAGGYALAAAADTNLHTLPQNFSQTVGVLGVDPSEDNLLRSSQYLDDANAPDTDRFMILRPASFYALQKMQRLTYADYIGPEAARDSAVQNKIPMFLGAAIYKSTLVRAPAAGQAENWFCHRKGVYYCSQQLKTNGQFVIERDSWVTTMTHIYGFAEALQPPITAGGGAATDVFNTVLYGTS